MGVFRKFDRNDTFSTVVWTTPLVSLASGTTGWRSSTGISSSLSLYPGIRSRLDVKAGDFLSSGISVYPLDPLDTHSIDKVIFVSGSYPSTGSIQLVKVRKADYSNFTQLISTDWYGEHFNPIEGLFNYYSAIDSNYFTGSYDYYCLFFDQTVSYDPAHVLFSGSQMSTLTSSMAAEARVKPTRLTGSRDFSIQSQRKRWKLFITGSSGKLAWTDYGSVVTSSVPLQLGIWQSVACSIGNGSASLYIDSTEVVRVAYTGSIAAYTGSFLSTASFFAIGAEYVLSGSSWVPDQGFSGYMMDSRTWNYKRSSSEISGSYLGYLASSGSARLLNYTRFNDGPLATAHGFSQGSGTLNRGSDGVNGQFTNFDEVLPRSPLWQPSDDSDFVVPKTRIDSSISMMRLVHVPSMFYGRQISTGSVQLVCNSYRGKGISRVIVDDGRGSLYVSGSMTRPLSGEDSSGVRWNKVGNVFYSEGLIVLTDPSLLDFGDVSKDWDGTSDHLSISFRGVNPVVTKFFLCRLGTVEGNASQNPSFSHPDSNDPRLMRVDDPTTWISAVGLYNEKRELVAIAKLASPIRKREKDRLTIRLKMDI